MPADRFREIEPRTAARSQASFQDFARLLFHRPAVAGRAQAQPCLNAIVEPAYRDARHSSMISLQSLLRWTTSAEPAHNVVTFATLERVTPRIMRRRGQSARKLAEADIEISSKRVADSREVTDAPIIYHYTDPKGLIGNLSDGQLRATDVRYLNDSSELRHAEAVQRQVLEGIIAESAEGSVQAKLATKAMEGGYPLKSENTYVVCFCSEDDLLTQWKTYGSWGSGFSIGFDRGKLESDLAALGPPPASLADILTGLGRTEISLARVRYSLGDQRRELRRAFNRYGECLSAGSSPSEIARCAAAVADNVGLSASRFKHPAFESEKEWRIVISAFASVSTLKLNFRPSNRAVVPYIKTNRQPDGKLPVVSVTVGPTLDQGLSELSVVDLLAARGYLGRAGVKINRSRVPLARTD